MKFIIDMNLSPSWVAYLEKEGWTAKHWSTVGAPDTLIMKWAKENNYIVFTHDLDFGAILAATNADAPSVIQVRSHDIMPATLSPRLVKVIQQFQTTLENGALLTIDDIKSRVRILPIK
ncbi:MAG: DUF5615 family PIN-like protein [Bacteroidota bacterium]